MSETLTKRDDLLPRIASGEPDAVSAFLKRYAPLVWSVAKKLWNDVASIEDVVQEIFIDLWKSAGRYDPSKASESTFIVTIARRRVIDRSRKVSRAPSQQNIDDVEISAEDPTLSGVDIGDEARRARQMLAHLKPDQRRVILMSVVEQLTHQEIAAATGLPLGTVKSHIRRGLDQAAKMMRSSRGENPS